MHWFKVFLQTIYINGRGGVFYCTLKPRFGPCACNDLDTFNDFSSHLWCKIGSVFFGVVYRSSNSSPENNSKLNELLSVAENRRCVIVGDFNYPDIDWESSLAGPNGYNFLESVQDFFLYQHIHKPTRAGNILDLVLSTEQNMIENITVNESFCTSDHNTIEFSITKQVQVKQSIELVPDFRRANFNALRKHFYEIDWSITLGDYDVENQWHVFCDKIRNASSRFIPQRKRRTNNRPQWLNKDVKKALNKKKKLWNKYVNSKNLNDLNVFKVHRKLCKKEIANAKLPLKVN